MEIKNLNLKPEIENLFINLEKNTGIEKTKFISGILNGTEDLESLATVNRMIEIEKNTNSRTYSNEEVKSILGF